MTQEATIAEPKTAEAETKSIAIEEVIDAERWYTPNGIWQLLRIHPYNVLDHAREMKPYRGNTSGEHGLHVRGDRLLAWIRREKIQYEITDVTKNLVPKLRRKRELAEKQRWQDAERRQAERDAEGVVGDALALIDKREADAKREAAEHQANLERDYLVLLLRHGQPTPNDTEHLADVITELSYTPERVRSDRKIIAQAGDWESRSPRVDRTWLYHICVTGRASAPHAGTP